METSNDSSSESLIFWEKIDQKPILLAKKGKNYEKISENPKKFQKKLSLVYPPSEFLMNFQMNWNLEKLRNATKRIQEASEEEIKNIGIKVRNQTKKDLLKTIINIQQSFQNNAFQMKKDQEKMQEELTKNTRVLKNLIEHTLLQQFLEDEYRLKDPLPKSPQVNLNEMNENIKNTIEKDNLRFETFKILNTSFKEEAETALNKVKLIDLEIGKIKANHEMNKKKLEQVIGAKEKIIVKEMQEIKNEFDDYKFKIMQELKIRQVLENRQQQFIESLYEELKNAKIILQNPTLRLKTYDKLRESNTPLHSDYFLPKVVVSQQSTKWDSRNLYSPIGGLSSCSTKSNRRTKSSMKP